MPRTSTFLAKQFWCHPGADKRQVQHEKEEAKES